jgi:hypothetical protein
MVSQKMSNYIIVIFLENRALFPRWLSCYNGKSLLDIVRGKQKWHHPHKQPLQDHFALSYIKGVPNNIQVEVIDVVYCILDAMFSQWVATLV